MKRILVVGASGALGRAILQELRHRGFATRALVTPGSEDKLTGLADEIRAGDALAPDSLAGICDEIDGVISALGKPVSLFRDDDSSFHDVDFLGNSNILEIALRRGVKHFVYISIFGSEAYGPDFAIARAHRDFENLLRSFPIHHAIIRPVGLFSGLRDLLLMAQKGAVITLGRGEARTNPIHHEDLAKIAVDHLEDERTLLEVGGPEIYTRWEIGEMACQAMNCENHVRLPDLAATIGIPLLHIYDRNFFDKLAFFKQVLTRDCVAPKAGTQRLPDYFATLAETLKAT